MSRVREEELEDFVRTLAAEGDPDAWEPFDEFGDMADTDPSNNGDVRDFGMRFARWMIAKRARAFLEGL